jgi:hypothetical protein
MFQNGFIKYVHLNLCSFLVTSPVLPKEIYFFRHQLTSLEQVWKIRMPEYNIVICIGMELGNRGLYFMLSSLLC